MLADLDLNHLLAYPVKDAEARKQFLLGVLVYLAGFVVPIVPLLLVTGYVMRIMRQVLNGEKPNMVEWDDWGQMLTDGARIFGVRLVYLLPFFLLFFPLIGLNLSIPFLLEGDNPEWIAFLFPVFMLGFFAIFLPFALVLGLVLPAAEVHVTDKAEFEAGFRIREWWGIFRANWGGFLLVVAITYGFSFVTSFIIQIFMFTFILICVLPLILPALGMYMMLVVYPAFAQAYKEGRDRLAAQAAEVSG